MQLKTELDAKRTDFESKAPQSKIDAYLDGVHAVEASGILAQALQVGDTAFDFTLSNATGKSISLSDKLKQGPVILTWYRGGWCPYCNITLRHLQSHLADFGAEGAQLIALTPEVPDKSLSTQEKHQLSFEVLSDLNNEVARSYGILFRLTPEVELLYRQSFDLLAYNGHDEPELPLAATYVIDQAGIIRYAFLDAEYRNRAEPSDMLAALKEL